MPSGDASNPGQLVPFEIGARRISGMDEQDGACTGAHFFFHGARVEVPRSVIRQRIGNGFDIVEGQKVVEQGVARSRDEHLVSGIQEQFEDERVGFTRTGRQKDVVRGNVFSVVFVVSGDLRSRVGESTRSRFID